MAVESLWRHDKEYPGNFEQIIGHGKGNPTLVPTACGGASRTLFRTAPNGGNHVDLTSYSVILSVAKDLARGTDVPSRF